mmetsp:Transcript_15756/g.47278  ORF Transcript_15756/g.47278 Transcript_15756/m.47278 type:complete len:628 (-) Transcript_15756:83-1966(-)
MNLGSDHIFGLRVYASSCQAANEVIFAVLHGAVDIFGHLHVDSPGARSAPQRGLHARRQAAEHKPRQLGTGVQLLGEVNHGVDTARVHCWDVREVKHDALHARVLHGLPHLIGNLGRPAEEEVAVEPQDLYAVPVRHEELVLGVGTWDGGLHLRQAGMPGDPRRVAVLHGEEDQGREEAKEDAQGDVEACHEGRHGHHAPLIERDPPLSLHEPLLDEICAQPDHVAGEDEARHGLDDDARGGQEDHEVHREVEEGPHPARVDVPHDHRYLEGLHRGVAAEGPQANVHEAQALYLGLLVAVPEAGLQGHQLCDGQCVDRPGNRHRGDERGRHLPVHRLGGLEMPKATRQACEGRPPLDPAGEREVPRGRGPRSLCAQLRRHGSGDGDDQHGGCPQGVRVPRQGRRVRVRQGQNHLQPGGSCGPQVGSGRPERGTGEREELLAGSERERLQQDEDSTSCQEACHHCVGKETQHAREPEAAHGIEGDAQERRGQGHDEHHVRAERLGLQPEVRLHTVRQLAEEHGHQGVHVGRGHKLAQEEQEHRACELRPHDLLEDLREVALEGRHAADEGGITGREGDGDRGAQEERQPVWPAPPDTRSEQRIPAFLHTGAPQEAAGVHEAADLRRDG